MNFFEYLLKATESLFENFLKVVAGTIFLFFVIVAGINYNQFIHGAATLIKEATCK